MLNYQRVGSKHQAEFHSPALCFESFWTQATHCDVIKTGKDIHRTPIETSQFGIPLLS